MKFRNGFVSNSSSSSFVLFVKHNNIMSLKDLPKWLESNNFEEHDLWTLREGGCDGDWERCRINKGILDVLVNHADDWIDESVDILVDPYWNFNEDTWGLSSMKNLPEDIKENIDTYDWGVFEVDYHGPDSVQDWRDFFKSWDDYRSKNQ